jgi:hypothetical protein
MKTAPWLFAALLFIPGAASSAPLIPAQPSTIHDPSLEAARQLMAFSLGMNRAEFERTTPGAIRWERFHGSHYSGWPDDSWLYRTRNRRFGGHLEVRTYLARDAKTPRIEWLRWRLGRADGLTPSRARALYDRFARDLRGSSRPLPPREEFTDFSDRDHLFQLQDRLVELELYSFPVLVQPDSITITVFGSPLVRESDSFWRFLDPLEVGVRRPLPESVLQDMARTLGKSDPELAEAVRDTVWRPSMRKVLVRALTTANALVTSPETRDLLLLASDSILGNFYSTDTSEVRRLRADLIPLKVEINPYYDGLGYCGSLLRPVAVRVGKNRWADWAFARMQFLGWDTDCRCGNGDLFRQVIRRGNAFLKQHPHSPATREVAFSIAQAHETAWSMSLASADDEVNPARYRSEAPEHRRLAIEGYRRLLPTIRKPELHWRMRMRLRRIELYFDTSSRDFLDYCC